MRKINNIVVHYSATYDDQDITAANIDVMHKARGWSGIGYHYFYRLNGMEEVGRPESKVGAHVAKHNANSIGLCFSGGLKRTSGANVGVNTMTAAQEKALISRIRKLKEAHPSAIVCGHRDLSATQCPGFDVKSWWAKVEAAGFKPIFHPEKVTPAPRTNWVVELLKKFLGKA
jgi:N-acetylmuramoyl-L-alanine amidase